MYFTKEERDFIKDLKHRLTGRKFRSMYQSDEWEIDHSGIYTDMFEGIYDQLMDLHFSPEGVLRDEFEER